jgi:hypothetical protein
MSRSKGHDQDRRRDAEQPEQGGRDMEEREEHERRTGQPETDQEARDWAQETGYRPSVNQRRHEPLPASHHADRHQEAAMRNEEQTGAAARAAPSPRARRRD